MKVSEFEEKVWELDAIRILIRASSDTEVEGYARQKAAQENWRITQFIKSRIQPKIGDLEVIVLQGDGEQPHGSVKLRSIRNSYHS